MSKIRTTRELPGDVGTVFVTNVPGSWFQLVGRRAYGELFVSFVIWPRNDQACRVTDMAAMGAEIVCGPEAEALLELVKPAIVRPQ